VHAACIQCGLAALIAGPVAAQTPAPTSSPRPPTPPTSSTSPTAAAPIRPVLNWKIDTPIAATGAVGLLLGATLDTEIKVVPPAGLDPLQIDLEIDRDAVGSNDKHADDTSDWIRSVTIAYPLFLAAGMAPEGTRWRSLADRSVLYGEALLLSGGLTAVGKVVWSRPRPFTYLPESQRPDDARYRIDNERAFQSMPSGHATTTWCAATFAITDHLISRPQAGWVERSAVAFGGALLATTTSALRVEAGQHFPTDVMAGGAIGAASGVAVPLLHRWVRGNDRAAMPTAKAWLQAAAGAAVGLGAGVLMSDWIAE
jgi:membrane-associated phospholipid phosphatase